MCSEQLPKEFEKTTEVLPFSKYGLSSMTEFQKAESEIQQLEKFKRAGLSDVEIKLYEQNEAGIIEQKKVESTVLKHKLNVIYDKIRKLENQNKHIKEETPTSENILKPLGTYPEGHPMNSIKQIEANLFNHLNTDDIPSLSKRRKILRRFERKKERILSGDHIKRYPDKKCNIDKSSSKWDMQELNKDILARTGSKWDIQEDQSTRHKPIKEMDRLVSSRPGSKWDIKQIPDRDKKSTKTQSAIDEETQPRPIPKNRLPIFTIKDNKIVRIEPQDEKERLDPQDNIVRLDAQDKIVRVEPQDNVESVEPRHNIVGVHSQELVPQDRIASRETEENVEDRLQQENEEQLLEGMKITVDDIKKIDEYKDYEPGIPSKVLIVKNISPSVSEEQLKLLFNQFILGNGGPVVVHMLQNRSIAYVYFTNEDTAIQALEEANGTVVAGRPIVAYFSMTRQR